MKKTIGWFSGPLLTVTSLMAMVNSDLAHSRSLNISNAPELQCSAHTEISKIKPKKARLKSYVTEYWRAAEQRVANFPTELKIKGFVIGDPHLENVDVFHSRGFQPAFRFAFNDMDEAGYNFLIGDLLKLLSYLPTLQKQKLNLENIVENYVLGLENRHLDPPAELAALLAISPAEYLKAERQYVNKLRIRGEEISRAQISKSEFDMLNALRNMQAVSRLSDILAWTDQNGTGSSAGMKRYLFHGKNQLKLQDGTLLPVGVEGVIEYKELTCTATGNQEKQNLTRDLEAFVEYDARFMQLPTAHTLLGKQAIVFVNGQYLLARTKIPGLYKNLNIESATADVVQMHAEYLAWFLGKFHRENSTMGYAQAVRQNRALLLTEAKLLGKAI